MFINLHVCPDAFARDQFEMHTFTVEIFSGRKEEQDTFKADTLVNNAVPTHSSIPFT